MTRPRWGRSSPSRRGGWLPVGPNPTSRWLDRRFTADHSVTFAYLRDTLCRGYTVFDSAAAADEVFRDLALADH